MVVSHKIFLARLFCAPLPAAPGGNCPPLPPLCYATARLKLAARAVLSADAGLLVIVIRLDIILWYTSRNWDESLSSTMLCELIPV